MTAIPYSSTARPSEVQNITEVEVLDILCYTIKTAEVARQTELKMPDFQHGRSQNFFFFGGGYKFSKVIVELLGVIRSISIKTSFLLHKNLSDLILGGYIKALTIYPPRRYGRDFQ